MIYQNFDLEIICPHGGDRLCARVLESPQGDCPFIDVKWPFDADTENGLLAEIYGGLRQRGARSSRASSIQDFGGKLFEAVFSGDIEHLFRSSLDTSFREGKGLRIRLRLPEDSELHMRPWEFLFDTEGREFLAVREHTPLVRYLPVAQPIPPITVEGPLRVLVALSSPTDHPRLDIAREWEILCHALEPSITAGHLELRRVPGRCTFDNLRDSLRHFGAHIFHFVGHGIPGALVLEQESGKGLEMEATHLRSAFPSGALPRLIVLNACSGAITQDVPFSGLAQGFLRQGVPAVVAMQASITDDAALIFTRYFYRDLVEIGAVDASLTEARLRMQGNGHPIEWGTPVLYMRALSGQLFQPVANPASILGAHPLAQPAANLVAHPVVHPAADLVANLVANADERKKPRAAQARAAPPAARLEPGLNERKKTKDVQPKQDVPPLQPGAGPPERKKPRTVRARETAPQPKPGPDLGEQGALAKLQATEVTPPRKPEPDVAGQDIAWKTRPGQSTPPVEPEPPPAAQHIAPEVQAAEPAALPKPAPKPAEQPIVPKVPAAQATSPLEPEPKPAGQNIAPKIQAEIPAAPPEQAPKPAEQPTAPKVQAGEAGPPLKPEPNPDEQHTHTKVPAKKYPPPPKLEPILNTQDIPPNVQPSESVPAFILEPEPEPQAQGIPGDAGTPKHAGPAPAKAPARPHSRRVLVYGSATGLLAVGLFIAISGDKFAPSGESTPATIPASTTAPTSASTATPPAPVARPGTALAPAPTVTVPPSPALPNGEAGHIVSRSGEQVKQDPDVQAKAPATKPKPAAPASRKSQQTAKPAPAKPADNCKSPVVSERSVNCVFSDR